MIASCDLLVNLLNIYLLFFNSILPGAITGDLVKVFYTKNIDEKLSRSYVLASTMMDRVIGLVALIGLSGVFSIIFYEDIIIVSDQLEKLLFFNYKYIICEELKKD